MKLRWTEVKITTGPFPLSQACGRWTRRMSGVRFEDIESQPQVWALICTCAFARLRSSWELTCGLSLPRGMAVVGFGEAQCLQWTAHVLPGLLCVTSESRLLKTNLQANRQRKFEWTRQVLKALQFWCSSAANVALIFFFCFFSFFGWHVGSQSPASELIVGTGKLRKKKEEGYWDGCNPSHYSQTDAETLT